MDGLALFLITFFLTNICCSAVIATLMVRWVKDPDLRDGRVLILALGLGPIAVSLVLYYLLWLIPGLAPLPASLLVMLPFAIGAVVGGKTWKELRRVAGGSLRSLFRWDFQKGIRGELALIVFSMVLLAGAVYTWSNKPLIDHDVLEYAMKGRLFLRDMAVTYGPYSYDTTTGFYYVGLHGFGFPLLATWEGMLGRVVGLEGDLWFRSITAWYCWLLVALLWRVLRDIDERAAWVALFTLPPTFGFIFLFTTYHVDALRDFLFTSSVLVQLLWIARPRRSTLLVFAMLAGLHAFTHSLGAIIGCAQIGLVLLFAQGGLMARVKWTSLAFVSFLVAGGIHYVIDVAKGTGWIFKDIDFY